MESIEKKTSNKPVVNGTGEIEHIFLNRNKAIRKAIKEARKAHMEGRKITDRKASFKPIKNREKIKQTFTLI